MFLFHCWYMVLMNVDLINWFFSTNFNINTICINMHSFKTIAYVMWILEWTSKNSWISSQPGTIRKTFARKYWINNDKEVLKTPIFGYGNVKTMQSWRFKPLCFSIIFVRKLSMRRFCLFFTTFSKCKLKLRFTVF